MVIIMILIIPYFVKYAFVSIHACIKQIFFLSPICFYLLIWDLMMIYKYLSTVSCIIVMGCQKSIKNHMKTLLPFLNISELMLP